MAGSLSLRSSVFCWPSHARKLAASFTAKSFDSLDPMQTDLTAAVSRSIMISVVAKSACTSPCSKPSAKV
eukprot:7629540-Alexandrium_andersonii.AAC.1